MTRIFVSHCSSDDGFANWLTAELQQRGYYVWIDHNNIPAGVRWTNAVEQALQQCDLMLLLLSEEAKLSRHVSTEWQAFYDQDKSIVPLMVRDCVKPMLLSLLQHIDFTNPDDHHSQLQVLLETLPAPANEIPPIVIDRPLKRGHTAQLDPGVVKEMEAIVDSGRSAQNERITQIVEAMSNINDDDLAVGEREVLFVFPRFKQTKMYKISEPLVVGWSHKSVEIQPDVDLGSMDARKHGVSRRHAMLVNTTFGLTLTDLDSTNGTFVGKVRLDPHEPVPLKNKAIIRLGGFVIQLHFKEGSQLQ